MKKQKKKKKLSCGYRCNQAGIKEDILSQINKNLVGLFESLPLVIANGRESNTNKSYIDYFIIQQKWANQFPEVNVMPTGELYVILYMLNLFQNNKSYPVMKMSYYTIRYFNEFFIGGRKLESHFIAKFLEGSNSCLVTQKIPKVFPQVQI